MDTLFYKDFFAPDPLLRQDSLLFRDRREEEAQTSLPAAAPLPSTLQRNDTVNITLMSALLLLFVVLHFSQKNLRQRFASLFFPSNLHGPATEAETIVTRRIHYCFMLLTALLSALLFYSYAQTRWNLELISLAPSHLLGIYTIVCLFFLLAKQALNYLTNIIFFTREQCRLWKENQMTLFAIESLLLFPLTLVDVYFDLPLINIVQGLALLLLFVKSVTIFKTYSIFFRHFYGVLHLFVYFCALEAIPLVVWWVTLVTISQELTTIF
ncbi:MAG: DUF4271 domain-containing protein [Bacteroidaceae bacterium]|nr:DUF4271 domain-containing protein [Bacteroidaceae bacterium]